MLLLLLLSLGGCWLRLWRTRRGREDLVVTADPRGGSREDGGGGGSGGSGAVVVDLVRRVRRLQLELVVVLLLRLLRLGRGLVPA